MLKVSCLLSRVPEDPGKGLPLNLISLPARKRWLQAYS